MASDKVNFALQVRSSASQVAQAQEALNILHGIYFDRGYNSGGLNPITDDDIDGHGVTAATIASMMTLSEQLTNFVDNLTVTQGDYGSTLNMARNDK